MKPCGGSAQLDACNSTPPAEQPVFHYEQQHVLVFSVYDSCRKDVLAPASMLDLDSDLALLGTASVSVDDLVQRIAKNEVDPRTALSLKLPLRRDKNQSFVTKTFEQLGKGVSMINSLSFFSPEASSREPVLVLTLAPIRFARRRSAAVRSALTHGRSAGTGMRYFWQQESLWQIVDSGRAPVHPSLPHTQPSGPAKASSDGATLTLLERNASHLPVIENAIARVEFYAQHSESEELPSVLSLVESANNFKLSCLAQAFNSAAGRSNSDDFR